MPTEFIPPISAVLALGISAALAWLMCKAEAL